MTIQRIVRKLGPARLDTWGLSLDGTEIDPSFEAMIRCSSGGRF